MLTALSIRNIVLIETLDLRFSGGLGVLTGETGAGKSILLDALGLALGNRADSALVRHGAENGQVTASFEPLDRAGIERWLADQAFEIDAGEPIVIRRQVKADGGSRAFVNDQPVSAALLRELGGRLVEIHGQHDDRGLINPRGHRDLLDAYARCDIEPCSTAYAAWRRALAELAAAADRAEADAREAEWLEHSLAELDAIAPELGEEQRLAEARADMQKGARLADQISELDRLLGGGDGALPQLRQAARKLDRIANEHRELTQALAAFDRAIAEAGEGEDALTRAKEALHFDPAELDAMERRLFELRALARKHRVEPDGLVQLHAEITERARVAAGDVSRLAELESQVGAAAAVYAAAAQELSEARAEAAQRLDAAVAAELAPLKLDAAKFRTAMTDMPEGQWSASGRDRVEFEISTNPGAPFAPLTKIASGGELSRFILALKVALAEVGGADTLIFDEIDRGVGGAVASAIGERLARLAQQKQLLVVTHSPQVAARADHHYRIAKSSADGATRTAVAALDDRARREEIARMLSGSDITDEARAQADRLLEAV